MPKYYEPDSEMVRKIFPRAVAEQLIGKEEESVPKSFIPDRQLSMLLSIVANHYRRLAKTLIKLHQRETNELLSFEQCAEKYRSVRTWMEFHKWLAEHLGSLEGFRTTAAVRSERLRQMEESPAMPPMPENQNQQPAQKQKTERGIF